MVVVVEARDEVGGEVMMEGSSLEGEEALERLAEVEKAGFLPNLPYALEIERGSTAMRKRS